MRRVLVAVALALSLFAAPLAAEAQQAGRVYRIGVLSPGTPHPSAPLEAFRQGLRDLGYVEGQNTMIEWKFAEGRNDQLGALAHDLVRSKVDVIFAINTPAAMAAKEATQTIPIVVTRVSDPAREGLVVSLARPGGNITGLTTISDELSGKRLELLKEALPRVRRLAILWNSANQGHARIVSEMKAAGPHLGLHIQVFGLERPDELTAAVRGIVGARAEALLVIDDLIISSLQAQILESAGRNRLPVVSQFREFAEAGGLMAYGPTNDEMFRRAGFFIDKILKGAKPADLPVEQPTKFEFVINLKTAKALGLTIPQSLLLRADQLIE